MTALRYAARARYIKNIPTQNVGLDGNGGSCSGTNGPIKRTLDEIARLKFQLDARTKEFEGLQEKLRSLEQARGESFLSGGE